MTQSEEARNLKLVLAYDGTAYHGWQRQADGIETIQGRLEALLGRIVGHPVNLHGAGRTDAGVHAQGQTANFRTTNLSIPLDGLRKAVNARLPEDIVVRSVSRVADDFHASLSAVGKTYRYRIGVGSQRPAALGHRTYRYWRPLDAQRMADAAVQLIGEHDFAGFASAGDERESTVRTIYRCAVAEQDAEIHVSVQGNGFLYNMVRNIVGTLVEIGRGHWPVERVGQILTSCDRRDAGPTAPACGLSMICVHYDPKDLAPRRI